MKNFPHQFNDLEKLFNALLIAKELIELDSPLTDENFGEKLTRKGIYTYRDKSLSIDAYLQSELLKSPSNRGFLTVARDIRRLLELLGFIATFPDKKAKLNATSIQLLNTSDLNLRQMLWKNAFMQLAIEGNDGEVSHPYRILLKLISSFPGIETKKLMLALEAENDTEEEFERIKTLVPLDYEIILARTQTSTPMAANAVKILPGVAVQLGDIERKNDKAFPLFIALVTEDDIFSETVETVQKAKLPAAGYRAVDAAEIAKDPNLQEVVSINIDLAEAVRIRQKRLVEHQQIVRELAAIHHEKGYDLYEGKFDCLAAKNKAALLYEVKTISESHFDEEKQTVKGVGQLKFYKHSIVKEKMGYENVREILVYSRKPSQHFIEFCFAENICVVWKETLSFYIQTMPSGNIEVFDPDNLL